jgi:hypothetical protein
VDTLEKSGVSTDEQDWPRYYSDVDTRKSFSSSVNLVSISIGEWSFTQHALLLSKKPYSLSFEGDAMCIWNCDDRGNHVGVYSTLFDDYIGISIDIAVGSNGSGSSWRNVYHHFPLSFS